MQNIDAAFNYDGLNHVKITWNNLDDTAFGHGHGSRRHPDYLLLRLFLSRSTLEIWYRTNGIDWDFLESYGHINNPHTARTSPNCPRQPQRGFFMICLHTRLKELLNHIRLSHVCREIGPCPWLRLSRTPMMCDVIEEP
ncbi:MAG: hypothetical protein MZU95_12440 [Desulfomicrobium escambiense]|nr:hypothetical protein [Desulfomicrobium escambiense]